MMHSLHANLVSLFSQVNSGIDGAFVPTEDLENDINAFSIRVVFVSVISLAVLTIVAALVNNRYEVLKMPLFVLIAFTMSTSSLILIGSTVYLNVRSDSGGPVHWHADFEIWACGNQLELRDPTGFLSNKIGTSTLHEHNDRRIHLEGVVVEEEVDASLGKFFNVIGGALTENTLLLPLNDDTSLTFEDEIDGDGENAPRPELLDPFVFTDANEGRFARFIDGQTCGDEYNGDVQVFVYNFDSDTKTYRQTKLTDPIPYSIFEDSNVPPGDCIIVEFDFAKEKTDKLCEQYGVRDIERCEQFGVDENKRSICENTQVDYDANTDYRIYEDPLPTVEELEAQGIDVSPGESVEITDGEEDTSTSSETQEADSEDPTEAETTESTEGSTQ